VSLASDLWDRNKDLAAVCLEHAFVRRLAEGSLPLECFKAYVAQDAYFLEAFARAYALALAQSPDRQGLQQFHALIAGVLEELKLHSDYALRWGVDLSHVEPAPATLAYTDFLLATAALTSVGETCAAMTPCMRLYAYLGQSLADVATPPGANPFHEWIDTYSSPEFESLATTLEELLNRYAEGTEAVRTAYRRALQLELAFFDAHRP
jgi:thiaminase/transcriptional activator TenA